ncbi:uncharacterized protein [Leptinotarsa decemlineata]|uniref:uncharacterized protein n=1 Tax=Leptinotarsa decemlineata TaxID=7539 RepID=UPI003D305639
MSKNRRSERLAEKREKEAISISSEREQDNISSRGLQLEQSNDIDDKNSTCKYSHADSKKKMSRQGSIQEKKSIKSKTSSARSEKVKKELMIQTEIKKKELEQKLLKKEQEILDLQLAFKLSQIEYESSDVSVEDESPSCGSGSVINNGSNVQKWVNEFTWNGNNDTKNCTPCCSQVCEPFSTLSNAEIYPTPKNANNCQNDVRKNFNSREMSSQSIDNNDIKKILTRQSVPKDLPNFNGDPTEWPNFIHQFENSTALCGYSKEENQSRLQKCLKGPAKKITQALLILPQNVDKVIELLKNRFGRSEHIITLLLDRLRKFPIIKEDKLDILIAFSDEVKNFVYTVQSLEENEHLCNPLLLQELLNKLPTSYKLNWVEYITEKTVKNKLIEFCSWLGSKANAACQLQIPQISEFKANKKNYRNKDITLATKYVSKKCICCKDQFHGLFSCHVFKSFSVDERWSFATKNRICFSCLTPFHGLKNCRRKKICTVDGCKRVHHELLHKNEENRETNSTSQVTDIETNCHISSNRRVLLKILPVSISNGKKEIDTYALLDDASTITLIDKDLADDLDLDGPQKSLCIQWTNNQTEEQDDSRIVTFKISSKTCNSNSNFYLRHVRTIKNLSLPKQTVDIDQISLKYPYIDNKIQSMIDVRPKILIGQDNWPLLVSKKIISGPWHGPALTKTLLGWVVHGNLHHSNDNMNTFVCFVDLKEKDELDILHDLIKEQWKMESFPTSRQSLSREDIRAQEIMDSTMRRIGDTFETGLLWKKSNHHLPESKKNAMRRLVCTEKRMHKDEEFGRMYCEKFEDMIKKNYISKISNDEDNLNDGKIWYLPHFGVMNPNKPNKLRIVFDASLKSNGNSLNDFLLTGPDLYNSLQTILLNFRIKRYAFSADIKEMFLRVNVRKEDRSAQRILYRGMRKDDDPDVYEINVVFFGSSCGPCLAQEAKNRNAKEFQEEYPEAVKAIINDHYMDDYLGGADNVQEAKQLIRDVIYVHSKGGFTICNWISNNPILFQDIDDSLLAKFDENLNSSEERILGIWWNPKKDIFQFKTKFHKIDKNLLEGNRRPTKREVLKIVMSVFDPLGFLANFLIQGKIILQKTWRSQIGWDDEIPDSLIIKWEKFIQDLRKVDDFKLPRQYCEMNRSDSEIQLHIFCDASENAYASVAYLRWSGKDGIKVCFLNARTRVSPIKPLSIPRLELQAALIGSRLGSSLKSVLNLKIDDTIYWTDSKTVLYWIRSEARRFKMFVAQRLGEIQELTNTCDWRYVGTKENVADEATKQYSKMDFSPDCRWLKGPEFLYMTAEFWPVEEKFRTNNNGQEVDLEENNVLVHVNMNDKGNVVTTDPNKFSKWQKLLRSTAWIYRFIQNCKTRAKTSGELEVSELNQAEKNLLSRCQEETFSEEMKSLRIHGIVKNTSRLYTLDCFLDEEGLIRLGGRLDNSKLLDEYVKRPIILDPKHKITKLLIFYYHEKFNHHGQDTVFNSMRQKFWILRMRQAIRSCWTNCQKCKNRKSLPKPPIMGQLPTCRIERTVRPFIKTGVDYFGPLLVSVKRSREKRYGVIFTCMVTRAIHLEIAHDLSTDGFIHVFRQFGSRRGFPQEMYSDNGGNFKGSDRELQKSLESFDQNKIKEFCTLKNVKWFFNPPLAPFMGGSWESLIKSIKKNVSEVLTTRYPQEYVLRTVFAEVENILNSRPLTHVPNDPDDMEALTPNHFLIGTCYSALPCAETDERDLCLLNKWKAAQKLTDLFWQRWAKEYLPSLAKRDKWHQQRRNVKIGDIVLFYDSNSPRNIWLKGRITNVHPGKDGKIRVVDVVTASGTTFKRAVSTLCILDVFKEKSPENNQI